MNTKDPALSKTPIATDDTVTQSVDKESVHNDPAVQEKPTTEAVRNHDELEENTEVNKGTDTFEEGIVDTRHVNKEDNPARQPDRRDQKGNPFDDGINERNVESDAPKSEGITEMNRYASIDNAQTRILNSDEKD